MGLVDMTPSALDVSDLEYFKKILYLQGDIEYGFYNLYLEWQSKDNTSSEQRWRVSRMVTDEVGQGLNLVRMLRKIGDRQLETRLEHKVMGEHEFSIFNSPLRTWSEVIAVTLVLTRINGYNLFVLSNSKVPELAEWASNCLRQDELHKEFAHNSVVELKEGRSKLGDMSELERKISELILEFNSLYAYGNHSPGSNRELGILFSDGEEVYSKFIEEIKEELVSLELEHCLNNL